MSNVIDQNSSMPRSDNPTLVSDNPLLDSSRLSNSPSSINWDEVIKLLFKVIRYTIGFCFIGMAAFLLYFILTEVFLAYQNISSNEFLNTIIQWISDKPIYTTEQGSPYVLGKSSAVIIGIVLAFWIASLGIKVACTFLTTGMKLLTMRPS